MERTVGRFQLWSEEWRTLQGTDLCVASRFYDVEHWTGVHRKIHENSVHVPSLFIRCADTEQKTAAGTHSLLGTRGLLLHWRPRWEHTSLLHHSGIEGIWNAYSQSWNWPRCWKRLSLQQLWERILYHVQPDIYQIQWHTQVQCPTIFNLEIVTIQCISNQIIVRFYNH